MRTLNYAQHILFKKKNLKSDLEQFSLQQLKYKSIFYVIEASFI